MKASALGLVFPVRLDGMGHTISKIKLVSFTFRAQTHVQTPQEGNKKGRKMNVHTHKEKSKCLEP